ncbi:hypothetical protein [Ancylomarina sp. 16SWW S1-10-2]|uniref:hypothetical protein n=1 Tax=Ancylomarina sp. 16SWW S1-10-2 TaxID=2499681 RepID=UPI0012ADB1C0|nr:hypothetical protein [Ancylomarina sp. 16SWW S1-10-2]MRT93507.1 hypothetical protein [Ancylomarina sp. 16SWW S1-10-2]
MLQTANPHIITTQIDSLHTQVQIIDTTVTHVHVYDTIVTHVYDTIQPDLITVYDKLITAQDNNFDNILVMIGVIVTLLVVGFAWFNIDVAKKLFRREFEGIIEEEKPKIKAETLVALDKDLAFMRAENARLFANSVGGKPDDIAERITWWSICIKEYTHASMEDGVSISYNKLKFALEIAIKSKDVFIKSYKKSRSTFKGIRKNVDFLPNIVSEKKEILKMIGELDEYYNKTEGIVDEAKQ